MTDVSAGTALRVHSSRKIRLPRCLIQKVSRYGDSQRVTKRVTKRVDAIEPVHRSDKPRSHHHDEGSASTGFARDPRSFRRRRDGCFISAGRGLQFVPQWPRRDRRTPLPGVGDGTANRLPPITPQSHHSPWPINRRYSVFSFDRRSS